MSRFGYLVFAFVLAIFSSSSGFAAASGDVRFRTVHLKAGGRSSMPKSPRRMRSVNGG
ncbi:hypothetical protein NB647_03510 [Oxalobacter aliiformigenes]|uniref:hypothetical protein n=1 Tax=Oxalobacter aliiformigenes TaxID=2946593 RepID=UPI0022AEEEAC|nr:hypothetical protein [Oxalobacter aliiformigenes]WAV89879.1 hypothetical protein NB647_03510 [Oxalobacter aliiformigenes]